MTPSGSNTGETPDFDAHSDRRGVRPWSRGGFPAELVALAVGSAMALPACWWVLGRLDDSGAGIVDPDYAVQPPEIDAMLAHLIGAGSTTIAVVTLAAMVASVLRGRWRPCIAGVFLPMATGFGYAGMAAHVATAPVVGANIGAGLMLLGVAPLGIVLLVVVGISTRRL